MYYDPIRHSGTFGVIVEVGRAWRWIKPGRPGGPARPRAAFVFFVLIGELAGVAPGEESGTRLQYTVSCGGCIDRLEIRGTAKGQRQVDL